jgi:hypothetical protein
MILDGDNMMKFLYIEISSAIITAVGFLLVHLYEFRNINGIFSCSVTQVIDGCANLWTYHALCRKTIFSTAKTSGVSCHVNSFDVSEL